MLLGVCVFLCVSVCACGMFFIISDNIGLLHLLSVFHTKQGGVVCNGVFDLS